jgi:hypothetical protein
LKLRSGASFSIPFEEILIFATNLDPEDLMDPAFLRRLPYKIEVGPPALDQYRSIFEKQSRRSGMELTDDVFKYMVYLITQEKELDLAGFQPTFIVDQVEATCRFLGKTPELKSPYIDYAINNLRVRKSAPARTMANALPRPAKETSREREPVDALHEY